MMKSFAESKVTQKANFLKSKNLYPFFRPIEGSEGSRVKIQGQSQIMIGSNNYLGLTHRKEVQEAAIDAIKKFGTGCTGSRFLNGNLTIHEELEEQLARFVGHEQALVFSTGMQTNLGTLPSICGPKDCMLFDSENHASTIDASRLAFGATFKFKHNNMESLEEQLKVTRPRFNRVTIVIDGIFSMTGALIKLPKLVELSKKYNALIYLDDAHGIGVMGENGRGTANHFNIEKDIHLNMGTFSKSFASIGGFVSGKKEIINHIKHSARSFMFSASMPPSAVATVSKCIDLLKKEPEILTQLWNNVRFMQEGFKEIGLYTYHSKTPIIPIFIGNDLKAMEVTNYLKDHGIFATPVISPAVPQGEALIRTSYMATHEKNDLEKVLEIFKKAKKDLKLPSKHFSRQ
jgi:8-amino-7-oxononanoate synthase